jgi:hypothetical protein
MKVDMWNYEEIRFKWGWANCGFFLIAWGWEGLVKFGGVVAFGN